MKKIMLRTAVIVLTAVLLAIACAFLDKGIRIYAAGSEEGEGRIFDGVQIGGIDVSGMTAEEAHEAVETRLNELFQTEITLITTGGNEVKMPFFELAPVWSNPGIVDEAASYTSVGNVIERYKMHKDIEHNGMNFQIEVGYDEGVVRSVVDEKCTAFDTPMENPTLSRNNGEFVITEGKEGYGVDSEQAVYKIQDELFANVVVGNPVVELPVVNKKPQAASEDLAKVKDVLGSFTTSFTSSGANRSKNVANGCRLINGTLLYPGEEFSALDKIQPFSEANGYYLAGSYLQGQVVESLGGGICQVSSTLYNAVLRAELQVTERHNHSMIVGYVDKSADAAIAESGGKNFRFVNNTDYPIYIEGYTQDKHITFKIYGVETRPSSHKVEFKSEVIEEKVPDKEVIVPAADYPIGYVSTQGMHIGYKAKLWKIIYENGTETGREVVNSSTYNPAPRTAVVGIGSTDPGYVNMMNAAIATGSIDACKATASQIQAQAALAALQGTVPTPPPTTGSIDP